LIFGKLLSFQRDLMDFLSYLLETPPKTKRNKAYYKLTRSFRFVISSFCTPGMAYDHRDVCTLPHNPRIVKNQELQFTLYDTKAKKCGCGTLISITSPNIVCCHAELHHADGGAA